MCIPCLCKQPHSQSMVEQASLGSFTQFPSLVARYSMIFLSLGCASILILFLHHADRPPFFFLNIPFSLPKSGIRIYRNFDTKSAKAWCARSRILRIRLCALLILPSSLQRAGDCSATSWRVRWYWDAMATAARFCVFCSSGSLDTRASSASSAALLAITQRGSRLMALSYSLDHFLISFWQTVMSPDRDGANTTVFRHPAINATWRNLTPGSVTMVLEN